MHISTAFVHGGNSGTPFSPLPQQLPDLGGRNPERLYRSAQNTPRAETTAAAGAAGGRSGPGKHAADAIDDLGYPNTYTFTKALGEHLLVRALHAHNRKQEAAVKVDEEEEGEEVMTEAFGGREGGDGEFLPRGGSGACCSRRCRLSLRIVRPSIVGPSWVFPWPGWTGEQPSTVTGGIDGWMNGWIMCIACVVICYPLTTCRVAVGGVTFCLQTQTSC